MKIVVDLDNDDFVINNWAWEEDEEGNKITDD